MKSQLLLLAALFTVMLLAGCASTAVSEQDKFSAGPQKQFNASVYTVPNSTRELAGPTPCTCMLCTNTTIEDASLWAEIKSLFGADIETSLVYGNCSFSACNRTMYQDLLETVSPDLYPRYFMLGQGPNPAEYSLAQRYCNGSLNMPIIWAVGNGTRPPITLARDMASCYLERNQMPVVVFYNNEPNNPIPVEVWKNTSISYDANWNGEEPIGPVVITTEALANLSDTSVRVRVKQEIDAIKDNCPRCLVALAPSDLDMDGLDYFLNSSNPSGAGKDARGVNYSDKIDLVGIGFIANDNEKDGQCLSAQTALGKRFIFSQDILRKYHKPSLWYAAGVATGNTSLPGCVWDEVQVRNAYQFMIEKATAFSQSGIVGIAPYRFLDTNSSLPIPCDSAKHSCDFGLKDGNGAQKDQVFFGYFSSCQYYMTGTAFGRNLPKSDTGQLPIIFSTNGRGDACIVTELAKLDRLSQIQIGAQPITPTIPEPDAALQKRVAALSCGKCLSAAAMPDTLCYGHRPPTEFNNPKYCSNYTEIEMSSLNSRVDPLLMRAIILGESTFRACAIAPSGIDPANCLVSGAQPPNVVKTRSLLGNSPSSACSAADILGEYDNSIPAGKEACGLGLTQCLEAPGQSDEFTASCTSGSYNPFDPYENTCCGANKFRKYYENRLKQVESAMRGSSDFAAEVGDAKEWYAAWLALTDYYVGPGAGAGYVQASDMVYYIEVIKDKSTDTYGGSVFKYLDMDILQTSARGQYYATNVLLRYNDAIELCGGGCPHTVCS